MLIEGLPDGMSIDSAPFFEAASHAFKFNSAWGLGAAQPPPFASRMLIERLLDGMSIDGTPFLEPGLHGSRLHME